MEKEIILDLYFNKHLKQIDIAIKLKISKSKISRIVSKDNRYIEEKEKRKQINRERHIEDTIKYIKEKRKRKGNDIIYEQLKQQFSKDIMELSKGRKTISNRAYRDWNSSIYKYNSKNKTYNLRKDIIVGFDVPRSIKW